MTNNPFFTLNYEPTFQSLGSDYYDEVKAAEFPQHLLRWRNDDLLLKMGLDPKAVSNEHFIEAFGKFAVENIKGDRTTDTEAEHPFLALRYHGYQFGEYNPFLGDGRGFLYGQIRGIDGELYDLGTKGSGRTPYSRGGDGKLTLKGGIREVLAAEALHRLGVKTSRCLSLVETGEQLWRGDEPSPTRSSVMIRFSRSHIRFGTFERLHFIERYDLIEKLLNHVIEIYYPLHPPLATPEEPTENYIRFYDQLVQRVAELAAQWMAAGFCHAVLNTDNMSITGESFDYGPYAFIPRYDPQFTAAYFDYYGRYAYGSQPSICKLNLEMLSSVLAPIIPASDMATSLAKFDDYYQRNYSQLILQKLGLEQIPEKPAKELLKLTINLLKDTSLGYHEFFIKFSDEFSPNWREDVDLIPNWASAGPWATWEEWRNLYQRLLQDLPTTEMGNVVKRLQQHNPKTVLLRPVIESIWEPITNEDNWEPFYQLVQQLQA